MKKQTATDSPAAKRAKLAKLLNDQHMMYSTGFYSSLGGRFFRARIEAGALQVNDWETWRDVQAGEFFRDHNGRDITAPYVVQS